MDTKCYILRSQQHFEIKPEHGMSNPKLSAAEKSTLRLKIIKYALKYSVTKAAAKFDVSHMSVRRWLQKYQEGGKENLTDAKRSTTDRSDTLPPAVTAAILTCKKDHPDWSALKIVQ